VSLHVCTVARQCVHCRWFCSLTEMIKTPDRPHEKIQRCAQQKEHKNIKPILIEIKVKLNL
jgi:hypothetical protein